MLRPVTATPRATTPSVWESEQAALDLAASRLKLDEAMHRVLRVPKRELTIQFPVRMDDGRVEAFTGYRVHHNLNRGAATGGVRFTADLTLDLVRSNAMLNTWKAALVQIPYGVSAGGVVVDPRRLSVSERKAMTRRYATDVSLLIGPDRDIPTPDVNTGSQTMAWIMDTFSMHRGHTIPGVVTGKPLAIGGTRGRREATSRGAFRCVAAAAQRRDIPLSAARVAIQGFGRVGTVLAELLDAAGCRVVAIADDRDAVANPDGISVPQAVAWARRTDSVREAPGAAAIERAAVFGVDCDIFISAGLQQQVDAAAAAHLKAAVLVEAGNAPTTPDGDALLRDRGVLVMPDILATAGGLVLAYFEWVQDMQAFFWTDQQITGELERIIDAAIEEVLAMSRSAAVDMRGAAMMVAVNRVAGATSLRGLYP
jgi:glutamate dehydrogenase (NAD(P)+)